MANLTRAERLKKYGLNNDGSVNEDLQRQNANIFERIGDTYLDINGNLLKSVVRGAEGLVEGVVGVAGEVGSIFGADTQWAEDIIAQTWTEDLFAGLPEATKNSFINELSEGGQETVRGIIDGVGQAATAVGLSFIHPAVAMTYMGASAAGRSMEESLHDGANFTDATTYGVTQGVLEAALEYVTGGASKLAKIGGKQAIKSTGKLIAGEALQEAAQEGIQGAINPITKQIYKGSEALEEYKQEGFWQDVGKQALIGGVSGSMGAGMGVGIQTTAAGGRKQFKVANASAQVQEALNETAEKYAKGKMSDTQLDSAVDDISAMNDRLEGFVSKLSFEQQQKMFQPNGEKPAKYRIPQGFEWTDSGLVRTSKATEENFNDIIKQGRASVSLLGREKEVSRLLEQTGATIYRGELASDENANYNKVRRFHQALASKGLVRSNLILVDEMANAEAFNSGDIIVLGKDQLSSEAGVKKILHEVTHFAEGTKEYKKFANFVLSLDGIKGINERILKTSGYGVTQDVIDSAIKKFKAGKELTKAEETYITEAVAFSAEALLSDEATIERLCKTDRNLAQKILRKIKEFIKVISGRFDGDEQLLKDLRKAEKLYIKALAKSGTEYLVKQQKAAENKINEEDAVKHSFSSISYTFFGEDGISIDQLEKEYRNTEGYKKYVEQCLNNMRQSIESFNEKDAREEIEKSIEGIVKVAVAMKKAGYDIFDDKAQRNTKDSKKRLLFSSLEPNSDYITSSDISTICDKRQNFAEIYDDIIRKEEELGVPADKRFFSNVDNYFVIHKIMAEKGLTQPCQQCYVESMRKNLHPMAEKFIQLIKEENENNTHNDQLYHQEGKDKGKQKANNAKLRKRVIKEINSRESLISMDDITIETLATESGLARLKVQAPLVYEAFNSFYGQSKPKMPKKATPFRFGELTALLTDSRGKIKKSFVNKIVSTGGFRFQSYSDFQIHNFVDVLQVLFEAGTLGLNGHAYTKVPAFISATKNTNLKRNISIFMYNDGGKWKLDRNDSFPYKLESIYDIVKEDKSGNTGIIAVVQNKDMAAWVMANDQVGFFIPFHKSGLKMDTVRDTVVVDEEGRKLKGYAETKDHTRQQTEVYKDTETKVDKGINIYKFWDFDNKDNLSKNELIKKNVMAYVDACEEKGYIPKFREYIMNNDDVLEGVLSYSKELGFVTEDATVEDICFEYKGYKIPYGYYKCLGDFGMFTPDGQASPIERLSLKKYDFDEAVDFFKNVESIKREEILQQFSNGKVREKYRNSDMTTAELVEEYQALRKKVVDEVVNRENDEIRFALKEDTRFKANHTQSKVYSREDTAKILNSIMESDYMGFDDSYADIKGHKYKVAEMLYRKMNSEKTEEREKVAYEIADYLIDNAAMQNIYVMDEQQEAMAILEVLRPYLHNLNLDSIKSEIKYKYDDKSAAVHLLWGKKEGGLRVDAIQQELEEIGINVKAENQADIFFEIVDMYKSARNIVNEKAKKLKNTLSTSELNETRDAIAKDILAAYDRYGRDSSLTKNENLIRKYKQKLAELKEKFRQYADRNHYETLILDACKKLKDKKNHRYKETSILADNVVTQFADVMGGIVARNQIRIDQMRERVLTLDDWYTEERLGMDFNWEVRFALEHLKATKKDANWTPTIEDYQAVNYVVREVLRLCQAYEQITVKGQKMLVEDLSTKGEGIIASGRNYRTGQGAGRKRFFDKVIDYFRKIVEPKVIFEQMESYNQEGVLTALFDELAAAETRQKYLNIQLTQEMDDFFRRNKGFGKERKSIIKFKGEDITTGQAMLLFLTAKRAEAKDSLFGEGGISFELNGRKQEIRNIQPSDLTELYNSFSDKAKEFIDIGHRLFNVHCRKAKVDADMKMWGFTNVGDRNDYVPIRREKFNFASATSDARAYMKDLVSVYNFSFNKQITQNQHVIYLEDLADVMQRHAHQVSVYAELSTPLKTFDKVYTRQLEGGKSIRKAANKVWGGFDDYIRDFLCDMQSNFRQKSNPIINWFRNAYTKFQLGFNVKSILSQTAAFPMAYVYLDADVMAKGATMKLDVEALDKYSQYAYVRDYEKAIISANSMMDKVKGFGEISMKPMQKMDRTVIGRIWNACQLQVEKDSGLKIGTEENYVEAAKLLEKVGRGTQANYSATERSAMMRSESEFVRSFTMFTSDAAKQLSRIVEAMGKVTCFREKIKSGNYTEQELKEFNEAKKQLQKTVGAVAASTTWYVLISMAMKWLFAKKDEEGEELNYMEEFGMGYVDSLFGLFPIVRDVYSSFADGYEINVFYVDSANTLLDATKKVATLGNKVVSNQPITTQEAMRTLRDVIYSLGQVTGIPTRNLYNQVSGLVSRFLPATGYKITSLFYSPYKSEMTKAIENGDVKMADAMMDRLLIDTSVKNTTKEQRTLYAELIKQGYDPLPRKVGETITHNEETVELTRTQRNEFIKSYGQATDKISAMMQSADFNRLSAEEKAKAIKQIYDVYYGQSMRTVFAEYEGGKIEMASASISAEKLAVYMAKIRSFESTLDKNGKPISGSKKQKVQNYVNSLKLSAAQKYMLMGLAGYKNKYGEQLVKSHINGLKLSKTEKEKLLSYSGY